MNFKDCIYLYKSAHSARTAFDATQKSLSENEKIIQAKMNGKTIEGLVLSLIGSIVWIAVFIIFAIRIWGAVNNSFIVFTMIFIDLLLLFMLIDNALDLSFIKKIDPYRKTILQFEKKISEGEESIAKTHDSFMDSKEKGWDVSLTVAESIPEEVTQMLTTMTQIESLKKGAINNIKNFFFFVTVFLVAIVGCMAQFPIGNTIITEMAGSFFTEMTGVKISSDWLLFFNLITLVFVLVATALVAKLAWSKSGCNVTNITLFVVLFGPLMFTIFTTILTFLGLLIIVILRVVIMIIMIAAIPALLVFSSCTGGNSDD